MQTDQHFYTVARYVERNARRARLVRSAEKWPWSSLSQRLVPPADEAPILSPWPVVHPDDWLAIVNEPHTEAELTAMRQCVQRGQPFGAPQWQKPTAQRLGLEFTFRPRGRPRKHKET